MATLNVNTYDFIRTLKEAGVPEPQAKGPAWFWGRIESGLFVMFPFKEWQRMELAMKLTDNPERPGARLFTRLLSTMLGVVGGVQAAQNVSESS